MLTDIFLKNFKSYSEANLKLAPLTVMIGANASGKSNAFEGIRLLSWLAQGEKLYSLQSRINHDRQILRGQIKNLPRVGMDSFELGCEMYDEVEKQHYRLQLAFEIRNEDEIHIVSESCEEIEGAFLYRTVHPTRGSEADILVEYNNFARGGRKPQVKCSDQQGIFFQLTSSSKLDKKHKKASATIPQVAILLEKYLSNILFLDAKPSLMRDYSFTSDDKRLNPHGENLSAILFRIWDADYDDMVLNLRTVLLNFVQSLPEQNIKAIDFLRGPRDEVMVQLVETFGNTERKIDASLLSDGTLRVLAIAAALLCSPRGSILIIEEIDNGVHPSRIKKLLGSIKDIAEYRNLKVILSSHNPALLNALPDKSLKDVIYCYRDPSDGTSRLMNLPDFPNYPGLIAQDSLGNLLYKGALENRLKNYPDEETRKQKALAWLESIR